MAKRLDNAAFLVSRLPLVRRNVPTDPCIDPADVLQEFPVLSESPNSEDCVSGVTKELSIANIHNQFLDCPQISFNEEDCEEGSNSSESGSSASSVSDLSDSSITTSSSLDTSQLSTSSSISTLSSITSNSSDTSNSSQSDDNSSSSSISSNSSTSSTSSSDLSSDSSLSSFSSSNSSDSSNSSISSSSSSSNNLGTIVAVGGANGETQLAYSNDNGETWIASSLDRSQTAYASAYNSSSGALLVCGANATLSRSFGNDIWENLTPPAAFAGQQLRGIAFGNGRFVLASAGVAALYYSDDDGDTWIATSGAGSDINTVKPIKFIDGFFVCPYTDSNPDIRALVSSDGITFANATGFSGGGSGSAVFKSGNTWLIPTNADTIWRTPNADPSSGWTKVLGTGSVLRHFAAAKYSGTWYSYAGQGIDQYRTSANDGVSWSAFTGSIFGGGGEETQSGIQFGDDGRTIIGGDSGGILTTDDGETFNISTSPFVSQVFNFAAIDDFDFDDSSSSNSNSSSSSA